MKKKLVSCVFLLKILFNAKQKHLNLFCLLKVGIQNILTTHPKRTTQTAAVSFFASRTGSKQETASPLLSILQSETMPFSTPTSLPPAAVSQGTKNSKSNTLEQPAVIRKRYSYQFFAAQFKVIFQSTFAIKRKFFCASV